MNGQQNKTKFSLLQQWLQLCPGRWASPGAGLPSGHSFGWYEVWDLFQSGITGRVSEEVLEWNCQSTLVLRVFCHNTLYIWTEILHNIWTEILHNLWWTILQRFNCCLPSDSKFTNLFWSCFVCLSILNLKSFSKIIATSFYIEGLSREHCLASLNSFSFLFLALANCRRSSRCSWTQRRLAETPRGPRRQYYHREPACAQTRRRGRPAKNLKFQYLFTNSTCAQLY